MPDLLLDTLPTVWEGRRIDPDFRHMVWLANTIRRADTDTDTALLAQEALRRFYLDPVPVAERPEAFAGLLRFFRGGVTDEDAAAASPGGSAGEITMDYHCDADYLLGAFQQVYGIDLTTAHLHWWRFRALLRALPGDTPLMRVVEIRQADTSGMDEQRRQWYEAMKELYALPDELKGGSRFVTPQDHDAAFLARF